MSETLKPFTVIGHYEDNSQLFAEHVWARNGLHAFGVLSAANPEADRAYSVALPGHLNEGADFEMPGSGLVYIDTVLEQPDVF